MGNAAVMVGLTLISTSADEIVVEVPSELLKYTLIVQFPVSWFPLRTAVMDV